LAVAVSRQHVRYWHKADMSYCTATINMMWKNTGINAVVAVTSVIWIITVAWLIGDALWQGLAAI
jgi:Fe2+ transport system protein B